MSITQTAKRHRVFQALISHLQECMKNLPDKRVGKNTFIQMKDIGLSAFSVFFTQCASFLEQQKTLKERTGKHNAATLFGIDHIPSDNHIRQLLDAVPASSFFPSYDYVLEQVQAAGHLDTFRCLDEQLLIAVDGVQYFSSNTLSCPQCKQRQHRDGHITYSHSLVATAIVHPDRGDVLPLRPEFMSPQDGHGKQDSEQAALKRWLITQGPHYARLKATLLGDDLYAHQPLCEAVLAAGFHFIWTCKEASHKTVYEWINPLLATDQLTAVEKQITVKKKKQHYRCYYVNHVPIREGEKALHVNWCQVDVFGQKGKRLYHGAFITDHTLTNDNVVAIAQAGRSRWRIENEHNNTLKNHGYHLAHNYGHGKQHLSETLITLILLSFLYHNVLQLLDKRYGLVRAKLPRYLFFQQIRTLLFYTCFSSWNTLMACMVSACGIAPHDTG